MFDEFFGVPMHPFAVHAPIVLLPIAAVVTLLFAFRDDLRRRASWAMPAAILVLAGMLFVAKESGESAKEAQNVFGDVSEHEELGNQTFVITVVWFLLVTALFAVDRRPQQAAAADLSAAASPVRRDPIALGLSVAVAVVAVVATVWLIRTGHEGAASRWDIG